MSKPFENLGVDDDTDDEILYYVEYWKDGDHKRHYIADVEPTQSYDEAMRLAWLFAASLVCSVEPQTRMERKDGRITVFRYDPSHSLLRSFRPEWYVETIHELALRKVDEKLKAELVRTGRWVTYCDEHRRIELAGRPVDPMRITY